MTTAKKRLLLTGATGFVGQRLCSDLSSRFHINGTCRRTPTHAEGWVPVVFQAEFDNPVRLVQEVRPEVVIHCLAIARGEPCVENPDLARKVNLDLTRKLGMECCRKGIRFLFTSTDQVFDGKAGPYGEEDEPKANGVYAQTKIDAEKALFDIFRERPDLLTVFRLALSYGWSDPAHPGPVGWILSSLGEGRTVSLFKDEFRNPLFVGDIAKAMRQCIEDDLAGLYHLGGRDRMDRHTLGVLVAERFGLDPSLCLARSVADHTGPEPRSANCTFAIDKFERVFGWKPLGVEEGFDRMVAEREC